MSDIRTGIGFDAHPFAPSDPYHGGRSLMLGGVAIPDHAGLAGWSDGDALLHAITDAILGAAGLGDIGRHFPSDDPQWEGADSRVFLHESAARAREAGWRIENVDATVLAEAPRIAPHAAAMVAKIADTLGIEPDRVSVKATTLEGMGFIGRGEGIAALAIATLAKGDGAR